MKNLIALLLLSTFLMNCSTDKEEEIIQAINGGEVLLNQIILIEHDNLIHESYDAVFNNNSIDVFKFNDNQLGFIVTSDIATVNEINNLSIPSLNLSTNYTVLPIDLNSSPTATLAPFIEKVNSIENFDIDQGSNIQLFLNNFKTYYDGLNNTDKKQLAEFYFANKDLFENELEIGGRITNDILSNLSKCETYTYATGVFGVLAAVSVTSLPAISILCSAAGVVSFYNAIKVCGTFASSSIKNISIEADETIFETLRMPQSNEIEFNLNMYKVLPFSIGLRPINTTDRNDNNNYIALYFKTIDFINDIITNKINVAIDFYNNNVPSFLEVDNFDIIETAGNSETDYTPITQELFEKFTFSIPDNNIRISTIRVDTEGDLTILLYYNNNNDFPETGIETTLNFSFADDFNNTQASIPIKVNKADDRLVKRWQFVTNNANLPEYNDECLGWNILQNFFVDFKLDGTIVIYPEVFTNGMPTNTYDRYHYSINDNTLKIYLSRYDALAYDVEFTVEDITANLNFSPLEGVFNFTGISPYNNESCTATNQKFYALGF